MTDFADAVTLRVDKRIITMHRSQIASPSAPSLAPYLFAESSHVAAVLVDLQRSIASCRPECLLLVA